MNQWMRGLERVLGNLAADAEVQRSYLRDLGVPEAADELALEFDDMYRPLRPLLEKTPDSMLLACLDTLDHLLDEADLEWDPEALGVSVKWQQIRAVAGRALTLIGEREK